MVERFEDHPGTPNHGPVVQFCWEYPGGDGPLHGPYDTLEECLKDARDYLHPGIKVKIKVGRVEYLKPAEFVPSDLDDVFEGMEQLVLDNTDIAFEDPIFEPKESREKSEEALREAMRKWANEHVKCIGWRMVAAREMELEGAQ